MENKMFNKNKNLSEQLDNLSRHYQSETGTEIKNNKLIWVQKVKTSSTSKVYTLKVVYDNKTPKVYLINQGIMKEENEKIPHTYQRIKKDNYELVQLCLYYPKYKEWKKHMYISETIIPWAIEWLFYYETWRITGEWLGGGIEHV